MTKQKQRLSPAQKAAKKKIQKEYMTIFINGKQKRVKRPVTIDVMDVDEFMRRNADPIWLHQNEMWEYMDLTAMIIVSSFRPPALILPFALSEVRPARWRGKATDKKQP